MSPNDTESRLVRVETWGAGVSAALEEVRSAMVNLSVRLSAMESRGADPGGDEKDAPNGEKIQRWTCSQCGHLLGFWDLQLDEIRIRHQKHTCTVRLDGPNSFIHVVCLKCSARNTVQWQPAGE